MGDSGTAAYRWLLFDFGGVIAEEGFREGLKAIARQQGYESDAFFLQAQDDVFDSGYALGSGSEAQFWQSLRQRYPLDLDDETLTTEILLRFKLRKEVLRAIGVLRQQGWRVGILSDQTDWLDRLNRSNHFYRGFDRVFNSYRTGRSKREQSTFTLISAELGVAPEEILFLDDSLANVERAREAGWSAMVCDSERCCIDTLARELDIEAQRFRLGVLSAGVALSRFNGDRREFLLLRSYNYWDFPKGIVELDETPFEAAQREVEEETSLQRVHYGPTTTYYDTEPYGRYNKVARYYLGEVEGGTVSLPINPELGRAEHHEYRWVDAEEAYELLNDRLRDVLQWAKEQTKPTRRVAN